MRDLKPRQRTVRPYPVGIDEIDVGRGVYDEVDLCTEVSVILPGQTHLNQANVTWGSKKKSIVSNVHRHDKRPSIVFTNGSVA